MNTIIIIILLLICAFVINKKEKFDLGVDLKHISYPGRFLLRHEIGTLKSKTSEQCKDLCNKLGRCKGISYNYINGDCSLYNDTYYVDQTDHNRISWKKFNSRIY